MDVASVFVEAQTQFNLTVVGCCSVNIDSFLLEACVCAKVVVISILQFSFINRVIQNVRVVTSPILSLVCFIH